MQETTIVGMIPMQETTNIVANVKDCPLSLSSLETLRQINHSLLFSRDPRDKAGQEDIYCHNKHEISG